LFKPILNKLIRKLQNSGVGALSMVVKKERYEEKL